MDFKIFLSCFLICASFALCRGQYRKLFLLYFLRFFFPLKGRTYGMTQEVKITENSRLGCNTLLHPLLRAEKVIQSSSKPLQIYSCIFIFPWLKFTITPFNKRLFSTVLLKTIHFSYQACVQAHYILFIWTWVVKSSRCFMGDLNTQFKWMISHKEVYLLLLPGSFA